MERLRTAPVAGSIETTPRKATVATLWFESVKLKLDLPCATS